MKVKVNRVLIASLLFGLFFGAGNLIFPVSMGQHAGNQSTSAAIGFIIAATGIPFLGVVAMALSNSNSTLEFTKMFGKKFSYAFTILLYLTIGPFFALPRLATVPYEVGVKPALNQDTSLLGLIIFSAIFFFVAYLFSRKENKLIDWVGKILTPLFLTMLGFLIVRALISPMGSGLTHSAIGSYSEGSFFTGFLEGYNTMDTLAAIAFGGIIISSVRSFGVEQPKEVAKHTVISGFLSVLLMGIIYGLLTWIGASSLSVMEVSSNGGIALSNISKYYLGNIGSIFFALIITVACLKTAIGLITSCSKIFTEMFPNSLSYLNYARLFSLISFLIACFGLNQIIALSKPVLMLIYPIAIACILLTLFGLSKSKYRVVFNITMILVTISAVFDFLNTLRQTIPAFTLFNGLLNSIEKMIPYFESGFFWIFMFGIGVAFGSIIQCYYSSKYKVVSST